MNQSTYVYTFCSGCHLNTHDEKFRYAQSVVCVFVCLSRDSVSGRGGQDQLCARVPSSEGRGWRGSPARPPQDPRGHHRTGPWYVLTYVLCQVY